MYIERITNRNSKSIWFIRESRWTNGRSVKLTIGKLPMPVIGGPRTHHKIQGKFVARQPSSPPDVLGLNETLQPILPS